MRQLQKVYLSRTQEGRPGLFTNRCIALHLTEDEFKQLSTDRDAFEAFCKRYLFEADHQDQLTHEREKV